MKNGKQQTPQNRGDKRQDELFFSSLPMFSMDQKKLKEELDNIVRKKEGK